MLLFASHVVTDLAVVWFPFRLSVISVCVKVLSSPY